MTDVQSQRGLNRATLARQYLLERAPARAIDAFEHLGGMQSQAPVLRHVAAYLLRERRDSRAVDGGKGR